MSQAVGVLENDGSSLAETIQARSIIIPLRIICLLLNWPAILFLLMLTAMLLRHPDVSFYEIDRVAFAVLVLSVVARAVVVRKPLCHIERATWPMLGLLLLAIAGLTGHPFEQETWSLAAAKFIVPFALFHLAGTVFSTEHALRQFETLALVVLGYLNFTAIAFLLGATWLIFPHFILDPSLGYHVDRARGPLLQAVANGVSINILGLLALHAFCRGRIKRLTAIVLLGSIPLAVLATMTRAVWLSFAGTVVVLALRSRNRVLRRICLALAVGGLIAVLAVMSYPTWRNALKDRLQERGPVDFRSAVYKAGWQMFLEKPLTGWGVNQMPAELARHVSGYKERLLYPHNTYLELIVEHGIIGLAFYAWLMWELWQLRRTPKEGLAKDEYLNQPFHSLWPVVLAVYFVNASLVVMNYQFVNGLLFTLAGMLAAQPRRIAACASSPRAR